MLTQYLAAPRGPFKVVVLAPYSTSPSINYKPNFSGRKSSCFAPTSKLQFNGNFAGTSRKELAISGKIADSEFIGGRLIQSKHVFRQNFLIRLSELGPDGMASIGALINILQETSVSHCKSAGIPIDGSCSTPEMRRRNVMWVVYRMKIMVDIYPSWADTIQADTWVCESGRNGLRREWIVRDYKTGKTLLRAVCVYVMMDKRTRRLSKFIEEVREEMKAIFVDVAHPILFIDHEDDRELCKLDVDTADNVRTGLLPIWSDLDFNQHVNHVKYIDWILESAPRSILVTHKLTTMTLEFRKECAMNTSIQSLSAVASRTDPPPDHHSTENENEEVELEHTIRVENESHVLLKGRTMWLPKISN